MAINLNQLAELIAVLSWSFVVPAVISHLKNRWKFCWFIFFCNISKHFLFLKLSWRHMRFSQIPLRTGDLALGTIKEIYVFIKIWWLAIHQCPDGGHICTYHAKEGSWGTRTLSTPCGEVNWLDNTNERSLETTIVRLSAYNCFHIWIQSVAKLMAFDEGHVGL